jgi:hypothetical protein
MALQEIAIWPTGFKIIILEIYRDVSTYIKECHLVVIRKMDFH